jgi:hypothetical protein
MRQDHPARRAVAPGASVARASGITAAPLFRAIEAARPTSLLDAGGIAEDRKGWLFRPARGHNGGVLSDKPMSQPDTCG